MFNGGIQTLKRAVKGWRRFLLLYLLLVLISNAIVIMPPDPGPADADQQSLMLRAPYYADASVTDIQLRYLDTHGGQPVTEAQPVMLLIHGSPLASSDVMRGLVKALEPAGRVIAPDLPGFGHSTRDIPDYGFKSQADYISRLIQQLDIPKAHLIAYSMGAGTALHLAQLLPDRVASLIMLLIASATLISEDLACIGAGLLAARGIIGLWPAVGGAFAGIVGGDLILFTLGRIIGRPALKRRPLKWFLTAEDIEYSSRWFAARGPGIILASRFIPGSRLPTFFSAGMLGRRMGPFIFYFCLAAALWTPALVGIAALIGQQLLAYYHLFQAYAVWAVLGLVLLIWATVKIVLPLFTYRGRRLWTARFRRLTRWEFWPLYIFYPPIVFYILYLGMRFRCLTLFTSANPGIPAGGIVGESKSDILQQLKPALGNVARFIRVPQTLPRQEQTQQVRLFMQRLRIDFPLVFKPDVGQRGEGVAIVTSLEQAEAYLRRSKSDTIVQEYIEGREFGVFYYRYPGSRSGRIFSITDKRLPTLTGDGQSTLEKLILDDERAISMAPVHFRKHKSRLHTVPAKGESIALVEVGTHCRGALFLDGNHLITPSLERAIDRISHRFSGFYFGRYDVRTPSVEAL